MSELYYLAILLLAGIATARLLTFLKLPDVTGYIVAGLVIGPSLFNLVPEQVSSQMYSVTQAALAFIAFSIGNELDIIKLTKLGRSAITISFTQAIGTWLTVFLLMAFFLKQPLPFSIVLAGIAMATAPAVTMMVLKQYRAQGPLVNMIWSVIALGDAIGIIFFGISMALAKSLVLQPEEISLFQSIALPVWEILGSIIVGLLFGWAFSWINLKVKNDNELLVITLALVLLGTSFALRAHLSPLLLCMTMGSMFATISRHSVRVVSKLEHFTPPLYVAFFVLAGASFDLRLLPDVGWIGLAYVIFRATGKIAGAWIGATISSSAIKIKKYLGFTLMPQAGISIGFAMLANDTFPDFGSKILTIITGAVIVFVLAGPYIIKTTLSKAGEIKPAVSSQ